MIVFVNCLGLGRDLKFNDTYYFVLHGVLINLYVKQNLSG